LEEFDMKGKPVPVYLLAGGRSALDRGPDPALTAVFSRTGRPEPTVAYVGAASGDNPAFRLMISRYLRAAGSGKVVPVPLAGRRFDRSSCEAILEGADIVYVSGGDVEAGMEILEKRGMTGFFIDLYRSGKPFFGLSAGSIMLAREWVRWSDPDDDSTAEIFPCLGAAQVICDTHGEGDDWVELKALLALESEGTVGYGIRSGASISIDPDGEVRVVGGIVDRFGKVGGAVGDPLPLKP
jgi:dipeptidase E